LRCGSSPHLRSRAHRSNRLHGESDPCPSSCLLGKAKSGAIPRITGSARRSANGFRYAGECSRSSVVGRYCNPQCNFTTAATLLTIILCS
jgi:hypothetical protein